MTKKNLKTKENREFWDKVDNTIKEVSSWPTWKHNNSIISRLTNAVEKGVRKSEEIQKIKDDLSSMGFRERKECRKAAKNYEKEIAENPKIFVGYLLRKLAEK